MATLQDFLMWLIGAGGSIMVVSWIAERIPAFQDLSSAARQYIMFGAAALVGCGSLVVMTYVPSATLDAITPYFLIVASVFATVFLGNTFHKVDARRL